MNIAGAHHRCLAAIVITMLAACSNGRGSVMPTWAARLDDTTIKSLTVYVHSLGGGQK